MEGLGCTVPISAVLLVGWLLPRTLPALPYLLLAVTFVPATAALFCSSVPCLLRWLRLVCTPSPLFFSFPCMPCFALFLPLLEFFDASQARGASGRAFSSKLGKTCGGFSFPGCHSWQCWREE